MYSWKDRDNALKGWEEDCIRGKGKLSGPWLLRNIAARSIHFKLLNACADRIEELETQVDELEFEISNRDYDEMMRD